MAHGVKHDYHLVDPSPWPAIGAASAFVLALGFIFLMNDNANWKIAFPLGLAGVLYTMFMWWRDIIREAVHEGHHTPVVKLHLRYGMMLFIASEVMFFVAWFWAYFGGWFYPTEAIGGVWPPKGIEVLDPFHIPLLNTMILLLSGTTVTWAHHAILEGKKDEVVNGLLLTVLLGALFTGFQAYEYVIASYTIKDTLFGSSFYMATGFHGAHVFIGTVFLVVCLFRAKADHFKADSHFGFEAAAWYWHFVDVVWLFLFLFVYVAATAGAPIAAH